MLKTTVGMNRINDVLKYPIDWEGLYLIIIQKLNSTTDKF